MSATSHPFLLQPRLLSLDRHGELNPDLLGPRTSLFFLSSSPSLLCFRLFLFPSLLFLL
jgi:hypothetical protein